MISRHMQSSSRERCSPVKGRNDSKPEACRAAPAGLLYQIGGSTTFFNRAARIFGWACCEEKKRSTSSSETASRVAGFQRGVWSLSIKRARTPSRKSARAQKLSDMTHPREKVSLKEGGFPRLSCSKIALPEAGEPLR